jgi:hypothetical protein
MHHTGPGLPASRGTGSHCEFDLTTQFIAIFTGYGDHCVATPRKIAADMDSPSGRRSYGDHK